MSPRSVPGGAAALVLAAAFALPAAAAKPELKAEVEAGIDALYRMEFDEAARRCERMRALGLCCKNREA